MTDRIAGALAIVIALAAAFVWGWCAGGRHSEKAVISKMETTTTDTLWEVIHDTCWRVESVKISRTDTVRLAQVVCAEIAPTTRDTLILHDSVYVEVPIDRKVFTGENYRITAHGYRIGLDDVWISHPVVTATSTASYTRTKRWNFNVGAQIGYGCTIHGGSPYIGLGVGFGYTF